ncbi:MAG: polymer-forming cytoskeletal protein [Candidatus Manganitrophaceae bacterium]|nr:MAG: polymer-forming cytoskeletal protein [Candidatus Manganitrophaceae bacterium]
MCNKVRKSFRNTLKRLAVIWTVALVFYPLYAAGQERPDDRSTKRIVTLREGEVVQEDYFAWGDVVEILGTVHGDVYAAGGEVRIAGDIDGDLLAAGGKVDVQGRIGQDARIAGGEVTVAGVIGRNLTAAGGEVTLADAAAVHGNVISAGDLTLSGRVDGYVKAMAGNLQVASPAKVGGDLTYRSPHPAQIDPGAKIGGMVMQKTPHQMFDFSPGQMIGAMAGLFLFLKMISFVSTWILGLLLIFLFPGFSRAVVSTLREQPMASLGWGLVWLIVTPVVLITLLVTVVGIPLALIFFPLYFISLYLARIFIILWAGTALLERMGKREHPGWGLLIGLFLYTLLTLIPGPGGLISLLVVLFGVGAALLTLRAEYAAA